MKFSSLFYAATVVFAVQGFGLSVASAQNQTQNAVVSGCASGGSCAALVTGYVNSLRASGASAGAINDAMAGLTVELANAAQSSPAAESQIVAGIRVAAAATTDIPRRNQMLAIAQTIQLGDDMPATAASGA